MALSAEYSDSAITHSKLGLGPEIKLLGFFNTINRRDSKALIPFSFSAFFHLTFPLLLDLK